LQESVLKIGKPHSQTVDALKLWLDGKSEGPSGRCAPSFSGLNSSRLENQNDLVALHPTFEKDWLARLADLPYLRLLCPIRSVPFYSTRILDLSHSNCRILMSMNQLLSSRCERSIKR
jgi:hypothetical protein